MTRRYQSPPDMQLAIDGISFVSRRVQYINYRGTLRLKHIQLRKRTNHRRCIKICPLTELTSTSMPLSGDGRQFTAHSSHKCTPRPFKLQVHISLLRYQFQRDLGLTPRTTAKSKAYSNPQTETGKLKLINGRAARPTALPSRSPLALSPFRASCVAAGHPSNTDRFLASTCRRQR